MTLYPVFYCYVVSQGCESSFSYGTKFSSSSKESAELLEFSSFSSVPLVYENFIKIGTKFQKLGGTAGTYFLELSSFTTLSNA